MKLLLTLPASFALGVCLAHAQSQPMVIVDNLAIVHEEKGWRVTNASTAPVHFNLSKGDLIVRIDGKNAAETGPMQMANLLNLGDRKQINLFIERGDFRLETGLRQIAAQDFDPVGIKPFRRVATGFSAPNAEFKDIDGQPVTLEQFSGKWLLIDFMATWCAPCMKALPTVLSAAGHNQLTLLTVALNDKTDAVRRVQKSYKIDSPIAMMPATAQLPMDFGITTNQWTGQIPALVLVRPDSEVKLVNIGCIDTCHIETTIRDLVGGKTDEAAK